MFTKLRVKKLVRSESTEVFSGKNVGLNVRFTLVEISSEPRLQKVIGRESELLALEGDDLDLDFAASEIYDCPSEAHYTVNGTMEDFIDCINAFEIDQNGSQMCADLSY